MDSHRFDAFTRTLSEGETRRGVVQSLAAVGLSLSLARLGLAEVEGKKRKRRKNKKKGKKKLSARCSKSKQCKGKLLCKTSNSQNSCFPTSEKRCCIEEDQPCDDGCDCCGIDVICNGGFCQNA